MTGGVHYFSNEGGEEAVESARQQGNQVEGRIKYLRNNSRTQRILAGFHKIWGFFFFCPRLVRQHSCTQGDHEGVQPEGGSRGFRGAALLLLHLQPSLQTQRHLDSGSPLQPRNPHTGVTPNTNTHTHTLSLSLSLSTSCSLTNWSYISIFQSEYFQACIRCQPCG